MRITGTGIWGAPPDREAARAVLREAIHLGVDFVDTADSYGPDVGEELVAEALHPYPGGARARHQGRLPPGRAVPSGGPTADLSTFELLARPACGGCGWRRSRSTTSTSQIPQCRSRSRSAPCPSCRRRERSSMSESRTSISSSSSRRAESSRSQLSRIATTSPSESTRTCCASCEEAGIAFVSWFPLLKGALAKRGNNAIRRVAAAHDATTAQIALAWLLHRSPALVAIPGTGDLGAPARECGGRRDRLSHPTS